MESLRFLYTSLPILDPTLTEIARIYMLALRAGEFSALRANRAEEVAKR